MKIYAQRKVKNPAGGRDIIPPEFCDDERFEYEVFTDDSKWPERFDSYEEAVDFIISHDVVFDEPISECDIVDKETGEVVASLSEIHDF